MLGVPDGAIREKVGRPMMGSRYWRLGIGVALAGALLLPAGVRAQNAPLAYVSNEGSGTVTIIDTATDQVVGTLTVGPGPRGIQVSPDGKRVYVAVSDLARTVETDADAIVDEMISRTLAVPPRFDEPVRGA